MSVKILWVNEEYDGPMNGVADYKGEKVFFVRLGTPSIISSSEVIISSNGEESDRLYQLYKIDEESMSTLEENHRDYSEKTGAPLNHGDPRKVKQRKKGTEVTKFVHNLPRNVQSEYVTTITESEFSNYFVPNRLEF